MKRHRLINIAVIALLLMGVNAVTLKARAKDDLDEDDDTTDVELAQV